MTQRHTVTKQLPLYKISLQNVSLISYKPFSYIQFASYSLKIRQKINKKIN